MIPADFRSEPGCESAGIAPLTVLWAVFLYWPFSLHPGFQWHTCASDKTAALPLPFGTQTLHANPKPTIQADFTEINTLFYLGIKHLHYVNSLDTGEWDKGLNSCLSFPLKLFKL